MSTAEQIPNTPDNEQQQAQQIVAAFPTTVNRQGYDWAKALLLHAKGRIKDITQDKKITVTPLKERLDKVRGWFDSKIKTLEELETKCKAYVAAYLEQELAERDQAQAQAAALINSGDVAGGHAMLSSVPIPADVDGLSVRELVDFEVTDQALVPEHLKVVDAGKVRGWIRVNKGVDGFEIPGIKIKTKVSIAVTP